MAANTHSQDTELSSSQYSYILDESQTGLDFSTNFSIAAWINLEQLPSSAGSIFYVMGKDDSGERSFYMRINSADDMVLAYFFNSAGVASGAGSDNALVDTATWIHLAATFNISTPLITLYKDGSPWASNMDATAATDIKNGTASFIVGAEGTHGAGTSNYFDGLEDEVVVTSDILTAGEVSKLYQGFAANTFLDNLQGYWQLNNSYVDLSGNGNTLTANGSTFSTTVPFANYKVDAAGGNPIFFSGGGIGVA